MLGHGLKKYPLKPGSISIIVAKSSDPKDSESIDLARKDKKESDFNPWKGYDDFCCYDVDFINTKTIDYRCDDKGSEKIVFLISLDPLGQDTKIVQIVEI